MDQLPFRLYLPREHEYGTAAFVRRDMQERPRQSHQGSLETLRSEVLPQRPRKRDRHLSFLPPDPLNEGESNRYVFTRQLCFYKFCAKTYSLFNSSIISISSGSFGNERFQNGVILTRAASIPG